ncbi:MAG: DoxX family protein [Alphaproteobacteria bacterium]|nr:DoxX family protein [Alphaproteobacteria bacterium]
MDIASWSPRMLSVLRIMTGLLFLEHGTQKLFAFPGPGPALNTLLVVQALLELVGGILIVIGLFTRPVAFILAGDMAVAYFYAHAPKGFFPSLNGGKLAILYCFVFLYLFVAGAGVWSVDEVRSRSRSLELSRA